MPLPEAAWLKAAHIVALCVWCAGLIFLPGLFAGRARRPDTPTLKRLWRFTWVGYRVVLSPAAVLAIATGTGLIFAYRVFVPWLFLKLLVVGCMVALHMYYGLVLAALAEPERCYPRWRSVALAVTANILILGVLLLVLGKPEIGISLFPDWLLRPGAGREIFQSSFESMRPI